MYEGFPSGHFGVTADLIDPQSVSYGRVHGDLVSYEWCLRLALLRRV